MRESSRTCFFFVTGAFLVVAWVSNLFGAGDSAASLGVFTHQGDVGSVSRPVAVTYDAPNNQYTIGASGANIWAAEDDFGFVWKKVSGEAAISADINFVGSSHQGHRKACLMFRQSLEPGSAYADVAVHGDGHIALQFRSDPGGVTRTIQCLEDAPKRVRLEKRGSYVTLSIANAEGVFSPSGCAIQLPLDGAFYVGLAVCAHDNTAFETATFSAVELSAPQAPSDPHASALEVITLDSLDRRVVYRTRERVESPNFSPDGTALYFNGGGRIQRLKLLTGEPPVVINTGGEIHCNNDHGISPDGSQLAISDLTETGKSLMYLLPIDGGIPKRVDVPEPAYWHGWSPDGGTLAYCAARNGEYDVYTIPVAGGKETRLTTTPGNDNGPDYTADGQWIYFHSNRTGQMQIWRMHADGSKPEQVTNDAYFNWFPHPSPDGRWIVFLSSKVVPKTGHPPDGEYFLRLLPAAGGVPREIARFYGSQGSLNSPCWSRDSKRIAYATYEPIP